MFSRGRSGYSSKCTLNKDVESSLAVEGHSNLLYKLSQITIDYILSVSDYSTTFTANAETS